MAGAVGLVRRIRPVFPGNLTVGPFVRFLLKEGRPGMKMEATEEKSFAPKLFPDGEPTNEWGVDELGAYARLQERHIVEGEKSLTAAYWKLGRALDLVLKILPRGHRGRYLEELGVHKTRAARARAISRTFAEEKEVFGLSVEEAYDQRQRRQSKSQPTDSPASTQRDKEVAALRKFAGTVARQAESVIDMAGFVNADDATELLPSFQDALRRLEKLIEQLEIQAAGPADEMPGDEAPPDPSTNSDTLDG